MANQPNQPQHQHGQQNQGQNQRQRGGGGGPSVQLLLQVDGDAKRERCKIVSTLAYPGREEIVELPLLLRKPNQVIGQPIPDPAHPGEVLQLTYNNGVAILNDLDLSRFPGFTEIAVIFSGTGKNYEATAPLPSQADLPPAATPTPPKVSGPDELVVNCEPVHGSETDWFLHGAVRAGGKGVKTAVLFSGGQVPVDTADDGSFTRTVRVRGHEEHVRVSVASQPDLSVLTELMGPHEHDQHGHGAHAHGPHHAHGAAHTAVHAPVPRGRFFGFVYSVRNWWRGLNNNHIFLVVLLLGLWIGLRTAQDLYQKVTDPFNQAEQAKSQQEEKPEWQLRRERMLGKAQEQFKSQAKQRQDASFFSEAVNTVFVVIGNHERSSFDRIIFFLLYWILVIPITAIVCFRDELASVADNVKERFAHKREPAEYIARRIKQGDVYKVFREKDGRTLGEKPKEEPSSDAKHHDDHGHGKSPFGAFKRELFIEIGIEFAKSIIKKYLHI